MARHRRLREARAQGIRSRDQEARHPTFGIDIAQHAHHPADTPDDQAPGVVAHRGQRAIAVDTDADERQPVRDDRGLDPRLVGPDELGEHGLRGGELSQSGALADDERIERSSAASAAAMLASALAGTTAKRGGRGHGRHRPLGLGRVTCGDRSRHTCCQAEREPRRDPGTAPATALGSTACPSWYGPRARSGSRACDASTRPARAHGAGWAPTEGVLPPTMAQPDVGLCCADVAQVLSPHLLVVEPVTPRTSPRARSPRSSRDTATSVRTRTSSRIGASNPRAPAPWRQHRAGEEARRGRALSVRPGHAPKTRSGESTSEWRASDVGAMRRREWRSCVARASQSRHVGAISSLRIPRGGVPTGFDPDIWRARTYSQQAPSDRRRALRGWRARDGRPWESARDGRHRSPWRARCVPMRRAHVRSERHTPSRARHPGPSRPRPS